ncbi:MAG: NAD(P)/FAD-dependent oxidoreductase [Pseudomonadota bacterium]
MSSDSAAKHVVIVGAGPAGLTAAYQLNKAAISSVILEQDTVVGGISRTARYKGFHFDIGGHRFFTKVEIVQTLWKEILGDEFLHRNRSSRIYYKRKFFQYPIQPLDTLKNIGPWESLLILASYLKVKFFPLKEDGTFENWVSNRFGRHLYGTFFKTYTEKVWGMSCREISADWAAQRIKGLSVKTALKNALVTGRAQYKGEVIKTLIDSFDYPRFGPGQMWEKVAEIVGAGHSEVRFECGAKRILWEPGRVVAIEYEQHGEDKRVEGSDFVSTMPVRDLVAGFSPPPPQEVVAAAQALRYRDFLTVALIIDQEEMFPDNWIYIHEAAVKVGRIQNFKNWSPHMVPDPKLTCVGLEYFCFEGDELWTMKDADLVSLATRELALLGLVDEKDVQDGAVVRMPKAYPVYDDHYISALETIRLFLDSLPNLQLAGRNGLHKYNNQDHSMFTAILASENIQGANHDIWSVNSDDEYHEEVRANDKSIADGAKVLEATQPIVPNTVASNAAVLNLALDRYLARMDKLALAAAMAIVATTLTLLLCTAAMLSDDAHAGAVVRALEDLLPGFSPSFGGLLSGSLATGFWAFAIGWTIAYFRNFSLGFYVWYVERKAELSALRNIFNYI